VTAQADGTFQSEMRYTAFGETRSSSGPTPTDYQYTGQRHEAEFGLYFYKARWYDPASAHFTQADTLIPEPGNPMALDRYAYVMNNPLKYTDPTGYWGYNVHEKPQDPLIGGWYVPDGNNWIKFSTIKENPEIGAKFYGINKNRMNREGKTELSDLVGENNVEASGNTNYSTTQVKNDLCGSIYLDEDLCNGRERFDGMNIPEETIFLGPTKKYIGGYDTFVIGGIIIDAGGVVADIVSIRYAIPQVSLYYGLMVEMPYASSLAIQGDPESFYIEYWQFTAPDKAVPFVGLAYSVSGIVIGFQEVSSWYEKVEHWK
jgi:RHS repeat-associated protein